MWIITGVVGGLIAGIIMGCVSQIGYWLGILKSHLIVVDGEFALRKMKQNPTTVRVYVTGVILHVITSIVFGVVYALAATLIHIDLRTIWAIALYVLVLWLAMLFIALPIAGQGFMGNRISRYAWLEQMVLHIIFGFSLWWALGII